MKGIMSAAKSCAKVLNWISICALIVMIGFTLADIFMRELFDAPITGTIEIARMMMVCMAPSFALALFEGRHVAVGMFIDKLGRKGQLAFDTAGYGLTSALGVLMCYQGFKEMIKKMAQNQVYSMLKIPSWPFYLIFAVSMGLFAIAILLRLIGLYCDKSYPAPLAPQNEENGGEQA